MCAVYILTGGCFVLGVIGLLMDYKPWQALVPERRILLGHWSVNKDGREYEAEWKFEENGDATVETKEYLDHGRWKLERSCMRVIWDSCIPETKTHCYETFFRPLKTTNVQGRSWQDDVDHVPDGEGCVRAKKIRDLK